MTTKRQFKGMANTSKNEVFDYIRNVVKKPLSEDLSVVLNEEVYYLPSDDETALIAIDCGGVRGNEVVFSTNMGEELDFTDVSLETLCEIADSLEQGNFTCEEI